MSKTFGEHFDDVCAGEYGLRPYDMRQYLSGEYYGTGKPDLSGVFAIEVIWDRQEIGAIAGLVRNTILPASLDSYSKEDEVDIMIRDARVMGNIAIASSQLTEASILGIVSERMPLRPFVPKVSARRKYMI